MSPDFDIKWLCLSSSAADGLDEAVAACNRPVVEQTDDGRFQTLLASHLRWSGTARPADCDQTVPLTPGNGQQSARILRDIDEQLARLRGSSIAV